MDEVQDLRALAHPLRLRILSLLTGATLSATEVGAELGTTQANASYHLRRLLAAGLVVVAEERQVRGGVAKLYRHPYDQPPDHAVGADYRVLAQELVRRSDQRAGTGAGWMTDAELWVDPDQWLAIAEAVSDLSGRLHAAARPPRTPGTVRTSTTIAMFALEDDAQ